MKKYEGYEQAEAFTGEYRNIPEGGYVCKILSVVSEDKDYWTLLRIGFDIAEGEYKDFYKEKFEADKKNNPEAKWRGMYYQTIKDSDLKFFKGFMSCIEKSNEGYKWDWDEKKLVGKLIGFIYASEEFVNSDGEVKITVKPRMARSIDVIKEGEYKIPELKKVKTETAAITWDTIGENSIDDCPF